MYYAITNDENRVKKDFAYDTTDYTLVLDHHMNTERVAWKWEDNIGNPKELNYYDYLITIESDKPVNIFEKHVIAVADTIVEGAIGSGFMIPKAHLPGNEMMGTGGATGFYSDLMVSASAGLPQLAGTVNANPLSFDTDETFFASMFAHYNQPCFNSVAPTAFGSELTNFLADMNPPLTFSLVNRFPGDFYSARFYGAAMSVFISTYKEDSNVRIKIYRKVVAAMDVLEIK